MIFPHISVSLYGVQGIKKKNKPDVTYFYVDILPRYK